MRAIHLLFLLPALILAGCPEGDGDDDDSAEPTPVTGRVHVLGGGTYETIQEAIDAAPTGGSVSLDPGCYDEAFEITKGISLSGDTPQTTVITGGGSGIVGVVDSTIDPVSLSNLRLYAPFDEPATLRALRVASSVDVVLNNVALGFETAVLPEADPDVCTRSMTESGITFANTNGFCSRGLLGLEISQSNVLVADTDITCVGYQNESGGTGVLMQTDSTLTITDSSIAGVGSFGIRAIDSTLTVNDVSVSQVLRDAAAQPGESNGSAIFVEAGTGEALVDGLTVTDGVFVGLWVEAPRLTVSNSSFTGYNYGIYMPGDNASAAGRTLTLTDSVFTDLRNEALLASASASIVGNEFRIDANADSGFGNEGVRLLGVDTIQEVVNNEFSGFSTRALAVFGDNNDGDVGEATIEGNTITNVVAGNGISVRWVDTAMLNGNVIDGVDHAYNTDPNNPGGIANGFGVDCFFVGSCQLNGNTITGSEFANIVVVDSTFSSTDDVLSDSYSRAMHIEGSTAVITNPTITDSYGFGILGVDSSILGSGGVIADQLRGPNFQDIDGFEDPLPEEIVYQQGGTSLYIQSNGAPSILQWIGGTFADSAGSSVTALDSQVELLDNDFLNSGFVDENGFGPNSAAIWISGNDPFAGNGPRFRGNVLDGGEGPWGVYMSGAPDAAITGNTVCVGTSSALYLRDSGGSLIEDNRFGNTDDPEVAACDTTDWLRALYVSGGDPTADQGMEIRENLIDAPTLGYGIYLTSLGDFTLADNSIGPTTTAAVYASMAVPDGLGVDADGDLRSIAGGDCNDSDPTIGGLNATEIPDDLVDNDCDGITDEGDSLLDNDGDGVPIVDGDCNDTDDTIHPGQTELIGNGIDDNCDGWADLDAAYALPVLTLTGNTIDQANDAFWMAGATVVLADPEPDGEPNVITGTTNRGVYLTDWQSSGPLYSPGGLVMGAETQLLGTGGHCIQSLAAGVQMELNGAVLQDCGNNGIDMANGASLVLNDAHINDALGSGVRAASGLVTGTGLTVTGASSTALLITGSEVALGELNATGGTQGVQITSGSLTLGGGLIESVTSAGFQISGGVVDLTDVTITGAGSQAINTTGGVTTVTGGAVVGPLAEGLRVSGVADVSTDGLAISGTTLEGYRLDAGSLSVTGGTVTGSLGDGILVGGGVLSVDGATVSASGGDGIALAGFSTVDVVDATLEFNTGFGLTCDGGVSDPASSQVDLATCTATFADNVAGDFELLNGCELVADCTAP